jgi:protocatechuate 3,4-dioxygenase, beta subunit
VGRTPHIHFAISGRGFERFITRIYVAGELRNESAPVLMGVRDPATRARLIVVPQPSPHVRPGGLSGELEIVLTDLACDDRPAYCGRGADT